MTAGLLLGPVSEQTQGNACSVSETDENLVAQQTQCFCVSGSDWTSSTRGVRLFYGISLSGNRHLLWTYTSCKQFAVSKPNGKIIMQCTLSAYACKQIASQFRNRTKKDRELNRRTTVYQRQNRQANRVLNNAAIA